MKEGQSKQFLYGVATAAILTFSVAPAWAQTSHTSNSDRSTKSVSNDHMVSADKLQGATVVDNQNKNVGKIKQIYLDPQSGKIQRADIDFSTGTGDTYSVTWNQLHVTRKDNGDIIARVDESVVRKVQQAANRNNNNTSNQRSSSR